MVVNFDGKNLPEVKLLNKSKLPEVAGIYFAVDNKNKIWYIGKAQNINKRWKNHHRFHQLTKIDRKNSIVLRWSECENNNDVLTKLENYFIANYFPALNQTKVEFKEITPAEISLRKTLAKISKYVIIYGYENHSEIFGLPTVFLKYDSLQNNPAKILRQIFNADNRKGNLKWSYYRRVKTNPIWKTKCNGISIVVGCDHNANFYIQNGEKITLAGISLLKISNKNYEKTIALKDWSQSYHPNIQKYIEDPLPLLWSKDLSFDLFNVKDIKKLNRERNRSKLGEGTNRGKQVKVYCEAIGRGEFVIRAYEEAIVWFGGYEILGLKKADYTQARIDAAPRWFKTHKVMIKVSEGKGYRSRSAPISASSNTELEKRLELIRNISSVHKQVTFKRQ